MSSNNSALVALARDYAAMSGMVFGSVPDFEDVLASVERLQELVDQR